METRTVVLLGLIAAISLVYCPALARSEADVEGSRDHPLFSRFPDSIIEEYHLSKFDQYLLVTGAIGLDCKPSESLDLEGKVTRIQYSFPEGRSPLEVHRSYQTAIEGAGFEILFAGKKDVLGEDFARCFVEEVNRIELMGEMSGEEPRYLCARLPRAEGDVYVSLLVNLDFDTPRAQLDIVEVQPMTIGQIRVNAAAIASSIGKTGHAAIYGILFDTGKAELKAESGPVLTEIAKVLRESPGLKLYVVGHTDNVGRLESNMTLSRDRAAAVVAVLVSEYGTDRARLAPHGVGPLAPVASNATEDGRAQNRRVELVKQ